LSLAPVFVAAGPRKETSAFSDARSRAAASKLDNMEGSILARISIFQVDY